MTRHSVFLLMAAAWPLTGISTRSGEGKRPGSNEPCRAAIWLDGVNLWTDFSVNSLDPSMIAAVE